jgi:radical SAM superfamily enzyme YgiQ (UPF0313 family)
MKLTLIKANMAGTKSKDAMQPLFAAAIAANTPPDVVIRFFDDRLEEIDFDEPTDLVALSFDTFSAKRAYGIAAEYRKRQVKVIAGGYHPTLLPEECLEHTDSVFIGDIEKSWKTVIDDYKNGLLKPIYQADPNIVGSDIQFDRSIFQTKHYGPVELVQWSRGCPFSCDYCSIRAFYDGKHLYRPIPELVNELKSLKKKIVFFVDDNLYFNRAVYKEFLLALIPLRIRWTCQISINIAQDDELLELMRKSGCFMVLIGIETFDEQNLKLMNKSWSTQKLSVSHAMTKLNNLGFLIYGTFIFGYDFDTKEAFQKAVDFAIEHRFFIANFNTLYPMPGTALYDRLRDNGQLLYDKWWLDDAFSYGKSMLRPKSMTPEELEIGCFQAKIRFNSWNSIFKRSLNPLFTQRSLLKTILFFIYNGINRQEIYKKQGAKLGK